MIRGLVKLAGAGRLVLAGACLVTAGAGCSRCGAADTPAAATAADAAAATPAAALVDAAAAVVTKNAAKPASAWNVILITIDSLRADMPWAGYERPIAPRLAALYAKSTAYTHAYSTSSFTSKSIPGLLTGRYPSELVRTGSFFTRYLNADQFLCTHLGKEGIPCVAGHAHAYFGPNQSGFETGFRTWKLVPGITFDYQTDPYVTSQKLTPLAIEILGETASGGEGEGGGQGKRPFFAWFHYMDPHDEYKTHEESPHFGRRARDLYDEEVFYTDLWIGKLLDYIEAQPWASETVIAVTADHGEAFGEHGAYRHAHEVWEELVHVPLFFYVPGGKPRTIDITRGHADIAPTVAELLGAKTTLVGDGGVARFPGTSLVKELLEPTATVEERDVIVDLPEDEHNERRRSLIHGRTKLIAFGADLRFSLFDLEADPHEAEDLIQKQSELATDMRRRYREASKRIVEVAPRGGIPGRDKP